MFAAHDFQIHVLQDRFTFDIADRKIFAGQCDGLLLWRMGDGDANGSNGMRDLNRFQALNLLNFVLGLGSQRRFISKPIHKRLQMRTFGFDFLIVSQSFFQLFLFIRQICFDIAGKQRQFFVLQLQRMRTHIFQKLTIVRHEEKRTTKLA